MGTSLAATRHPRTRRWIWFRIPTPVSTHAVVLNTITVDAYKRINFKNRQARRAHRRPRFPAPKSRRHNSINARLPLCKAESHRNTLTQRSRSKSVESVEQELAQVWRWRALQMLQSPPSRLGKRRPCFWVGHLFIKATHLAIEFRRRITRTASLCGAKSEKGSYKCSTRDVISSCDCQKPYSNRPPLTINNTRTIDIADSKHKEIKRPRVARTPVAFPDLMRQSLNWSQYTDCQTKFHNKQSLITVNKKIWIMSSI